MRNPFKILVHCIITSRIAVTLCKYTAWNDINTAINEGSRMKDCVSGIKIMHHQIFMSFV
jgi:hypothetical protein